MNEQQAKLKLVLTNILNNNIVINDKQKTVIINYVIENNHICINCMKVAQMWENERPNKESLIFFLDILIEFSKNKDIFVLLHQNNIFKHTINVFQTNDYTKDCDIFKKYIKLLDIFTYNECGRNWLVDSWDCWKSVFKVIGTQKYTEDLSVLLKGLFLSVVDSSELFSMDLTKLILTPLLKVCVVISQKKLNLVLEDDLYYDLTPTINLISSVILKISGNITLNNQWLKHCNNLLTLQKPTNILLEFVEGRQLTQELSKLRLGLHFLEITQNPNNHQQLINLFFDRTLKILELNSDRGFMDNIVILAYHLRNYWYHICRLFDVTKLNLPFDFDPCICVYQTSVLYATILKCIEFKVKDVLKNDELRDHFVSELIKKIDKPHQFQLYKYRRNLLKQDNYVPVARLALDYIKKSFEVYNKSCKIIMFNVLIYFMGDLVSDIHKNKGVRSEFYDSGLVTHFLDTFVAYVKKCDITWKEVTTHMLALVTVTDLLQVQDLPSEVVVAALKMLDLAIAKRMAPDLTLLVDCNSLNSIGSLLNSKLNSGNAEVRCAASKVLVTVSESAKSNYPFFQKILLDSELPQQLVTRIFNKEMVEVRSNCLKCLQHLIQITSIWDAISSFFNILDSTINLLKTETDNLIKIELINLVTVIYEEDYFNDLQVNELYDLMTSLEMHCRINCLNFWSIVIKKLLKEEGMIDGEFPEVTFSKESRKIVVLDEDEIQRRLRRLMKKLSDIGCLEVLYSSFTSSEELENLYVNEIVYDLLAILKNHNINENMLNNCQKSKQFLENIHSSANGNINVNDRRLMITLDEILKHNDIPKL